MTVLRDNRIVSFLTLGLQLLPLLPLTSRLLCWAELLCIVPIKELSRNCTDTKIGHWCYKGNYDEAEKEAE